MSKPAEQFDLFCPHCNILVVAKVEGSASGPVTEAAAALCPEDSLYSAVRFHLALCGRCGGPFLVETVSYELADEFAGTASERVLYPAVREGSPAGLPATVERAFQHAARSFQSGLYEPCVVMCRKALEALSVELGATKGSLKQRLGQLAQEGRLDQRLFTWAEQLRAVGNDAAHELDLIITVDDARDALDFVEAILIHVFTLTRKFEAFAKRRQERKVPKDGG